MNNILVTGGAGFVGSNLCERLLNDGNKVICLDNFFTGKKENIKKFENNKNFTLIEHDIIDEIDIKNINQIYNLACPASPPHYQFDPIKTTKTSVFGIINMLNLARKNNAKILQASTSEVYGDPKIHPQTEDYWGNVNPVGIRSCYDEGKRCAESLMTDYNRMYGTKIAIARIFNTYGPKMSINDGRVVSNFIIQALNNEPITVYGSGSQTRSFCYIDDLVDGLIKLMDNNYTEPFNIGNPDEHTILEFANLIIKMTDSKSEIIFKPLPQDDPVKRKPNISKAQKFLCYNPKVTLESGILHTINYFKNLI